MVAALALAGCATPADRLVMLDHLPPADAVVQRLVLDSPWPAAPDEDVLALPPAVRTFVDAHLRGLPPRARLQRLGGLFARGGALELRYDQSVTLPASGVFASRQGNCLSFTLLFIALARELGIHARFQEAQVATTWTRLGETVLVNRHITAWGFVPGASFEADFGDFDLTPGTLRQVISDTRARAQYFNNRGAEHLVRGDPGAAIGQFNRALRLDPALPYVWTNLGTALRQVQRPADADLAWRHALRLDGGAVPALNGLARLARDRGDVAAASALQRLAERQNARNPYRRHAAAEAALAAGDPAAAIKALREAIRLSPAEPEFHFALGRAWLAAGDRDRALAAFEDLQAQVTDPDQQRIYADRLRVMLAVGDRAASTP